jgi:hypothetical protein
MLWDTLFSRDAVAGNPTGCPPADRSKKTM